MNDEIKRVRRNLRFNRLECISQNPLHVIFLITARFKICKKTRFFKTAYMENSLINFEQTFIDFISGIFKLWIGSLFLDRRSLDYLEWHKICRDLESCWYKLIRPYRLLLEILTKKYWLDSVQSQCRLHPEKSFI